jgi:hypothetical protein
VDLSPRQRSAVFAVIVIVLAVFGYYLVAPAITHHGSAQPGTSPTASAGTSAPAAPATTTAPAITASPADASGVNIYNWLPFTQQDLSTAASVAVRFSVDYNTFTYTESAASYVGAMGGLVTSQFAATLRADYQTVGVAQLRTSQKQISTGSAAISALSAFGPSSMTFVVTAGQRLATTNGTSNGSTQYAVTLTGSGGGWQVSNIELESTGNT